LVSGAFLNKDFWKVNLTYGREQQLETAFMRAVTFIVKTPEYRETSLVEQVLEARQLRVQE
jgi:hypothetical protein